MRPAALRTMRRAQRGSNLGEAVEDGDVAEAVMPERESGGEPARTSADDGDLEIGRTIVLRVERLDRRRREHARAPSR